jgi:two-component system response regulator NreC
MAIRIFCIEDQPIITEGYKSFIDQSEFLMWSGMSNGGEDLELKLKECRYDIVILDIHLGDLNGFDVYQNKIKPQTKVPVLVISATGKLNNILKARNLGIVGFVTKFITSLEFEQAIKKATSPPNSFFVSADLEGLLNDYDNNKISVLPLTPREIELIPHLISGKSSVEIAKTLSTSYYTLETHKKNIFKKLNIQTVLQLLHYAKEHELV